VTALSRDKFTEKIKKSVDFFMFLCYTEKNIRERKLILMKKVTIEMENGGVMTLELYEDKAPVTTENFIKLAKEGFYDGLIFHRVIKGFMIQGGDPTGTGMGGPGYQIKGEFASNGVKNDLRHTRGVISMARSMMPDSAGSQFFIMHKDAPHLDGQYAAFGKMTDGFDVLDAIATVATDRSDRPREEQKIKHITVVEE
jgi:peptidyl-prolyl cis-trans isomerase B (cyclophilin B)